MSFGYDHRAAAAAPSPPSPLDLPAFLPYACKKLGAPFNVRVDVKTQEEYVSKIDTPKKQPKSKTVSRQHSAPETVKGEESITSPPFFYAEEGDEVTVTAVMDVWGHLVEIDFQSEPHVPCLLIKIIGMCLPFHELFNKLMVRWSYLDGVTLYEISKYLTVSRLTELCLDDSPVPDRNYAILLEGPSHLRHLSLARCNLDDDDCVAISAKLMYPLAAATTLQLLNLASNAIDDVGAHALGQMLRSNRSLQYLNLSGNRITDDGAEEIFKSLVDFTLTTRELQEKRLRLIDHLKLRKEVYERCLLEAMREGDAARSKTSKRPPARGVKRGGGARSLLEMAAARADTVAGQQLAAAAAAEPFAPGEVAAGARGLRCRGNRSLCCLNLCYNNLGYRSVAALLDVLLRQSSGTSKFGAGLIRALVEGNPLPELCAEYERTDELLDELYKAKEAAARPARRPDRVTKSKSQTLRTK